ncbi:Bax inhibitor-1/YccA family protein [Alloprevotella sp. Lung230]|uniref:Bax inhibitor-1/YccA family protein n=1 Tax=Alloprevotella sp. Lung230 TaxID=2766595 RepID=UPI001655A310|nr:Bax inhibitor-1/YccA family protein [Alloprevotella sp. Lung230]MBC8625902.1 Bax inhibitor-1/YccA family protein [Alloprevotella sp. Lung230]
MLPQDNYNRSYVSPGRDRSLSFPSLMRSVYIWMALALAVTGLTAMTIATQPQIVYAIFANRAIFWMLILAELGMVIYLSARIMSMSFATAGIVFVVYALLNGVTLSSLFLAYTAESIAQTFFVTAGTFGAMAVIGFLVKRDLSAIGRFFYMALIGLIIATVANAFFHNSGVAMICNYAGVVIFSGLTAYDTQKIKNMLVQFGDRRDETVMKLALLGSLSLYLDFINLFLYLLRFLGNRR